MLRGVLREVAKRVGENFLKGFFLASPIWTHYTISKLTVGVGTNLQAQQGPFSSLLAHMSGSRPGSSWLTQNPACSFFFFRNDILRV